MCLAGCNCLLQAISRPGLPPGKLPTHGRRSRATKATRSTGGKLLEEKHGVSASSIDYAVRKPGEPQVKHHSGNSNAEARGTPRCSSKRRGKPAAGNERCPSRITGSATQIRERWGRGVEAPSSPLLQSISTRDGWEQPIPGVPLEELGGKNEPICFLRDRVISYTLQ